MGVRHKAPDALGRREDDIGRTHLHGSASLIGGSSVSLDC
jgi:hypothetical protein